MNKPHELDSAADWATWYRQQYEQLLTAVNEVLDLDAKCVIALPPDTLQRLKAFEQRETECAQCGSVQLCKDDGEAYVCIDEEACHERQEARW